MFVKHSAPNFMFVHKGSTLFLNKGHNSITIFFRIP